jgi:hypothetical protein
LPVIPEKVAKRILRIKPSSAPGLDGTRKKHLKDQKFLPVLGKVFSLLMMTGVYPESWLQIRMINIPKHGKGSWRPITIVSILARMYTSLLDGRLRGLPA